MNKPDEGFLMLYPPSGQPHHPTVNGTPYFFKEPQPLAATDQTERLVFETTGFGLFTKVAENRYPDVMNTVAIHTQSAYSHVDYSLLRANAAPCSVYVVNPRNTEKIPGLISGYKVCQVYGREEQG